jgi:hypothetical protein
MFAPNPAATNPADFGFCTLALRPKYRQLAQQLAADLATYAPGITLVVGTDRPQEFAHCANVWAFKLKSQGVLHCFHDKRFVLAQARSRFKIVVQLDADTQMIGQLSSIDAPQLAAPQLAAIHQENLLEHTHRYNPERLPHLRKLADKLELDLAQVTYVGEALFALAAPVAQCDAFVQQWDGIARYLELHGIHAGEGNAIGLAAAKVGLAITQPDWLTAIDADRHHFDASTQRPADRPAQQLIRRCRYHLRLNQSRLRAIGRWQFYYG